MSATRSLLRWVAPLARWTGLDTNPLRRGSDRAEAWIRLSLILAFLIGSPVTAGAVGEWAHAESVSAARAEAASEHRVPAVLLHVATLGDGYPVRQTKRMSWVKARWTAPDGSPRSGEVPAPAGTRAGSTVRIWTDRAGRLADPPVGSDQILSRMIAVATLGCAALALALLTIMWLARRILDRGRLAAWEASWSAVEPQWTKRLH